MSRPRARRLAACLALAVCAGATCLGAGVQAEDEAHPGAPADAQAWNEARALRQRLEDPERGREAVAPLIEVVFELARGRASEAQQAFELFDLVRDLARLPPEWLPDGFDLVELHGGALEFARALGMAEVTGLGYVRLGQHLFDQRRLGEARAILREGIEGLGAGGGRLLELDLMLASLEGYQGNYEEAWRRIEHAHGVLYGGGGRAGIDREWPLFPRHEAMLFGARGELHYLLGNLDLAAADLARERRLAAGEGSAMLELRVLVHTLDLELALGRTDEVEERIAHGLARPAWPSYHLGLRLRRAAARAEEIDDPARLAAAGAELEELLGAAEARAFDRVRARLDLALVRLREGRLGEAVTRLAEARSDLAEMTREEGGAPELELRCAALEGALAVARSERGETVDLAPPARALAAALRSWLERWDRTPLMPSGVGFLQHGARAFYLGEALRLARLVAPGEAGLRDALELLIEAQARGSLARRAGFRARPFAELRALWTGAPEERRGVLVYVPGPDRTELFAFDARRLAHAELPGLARLEGPRADLEALLAAPPDAEAAARGRAALLEHRAARRLTELLLPASVRALVAQWSGLTVVGLESLGYVPFEFLPLDERRFLGDELAVAYLPSLPLGAILAERTRSTGEGGLLVVAATEVAPELRAREPALVPLPFGEEDSRRWTAAWERSSVVTGAEARAAARFAEAAVLVLLAHGVHDRDLGPGVALVPAREGELGLFFPVDALATAWPEHVVLASCGAGRARLRRGEDGVTSFAGSMLAAGARSVVLGPGPLSYRALIELGARYQAHLLAGTSPAEALRRARRELPGSLAHPFYSCLHVTGLGHEAVVRR